MSILVFIIVVLVVPALALYGVNLIPDSPPASAQIKLIVRVLLIVLAIVLIVTRSGLLGSL